MVWYKKKSQVSLQPYFKRSRQSEGSKINIYTKHSSLFVENRFLNLRYLPEKRNETDIFCKHSEIEKRFVNVAIDSISFSNFFPTRQKKKIDKTSNDIIAGNGGD